MKGLIILTIGFLLVFIIDMYIDSVFKIED